MSHLAVAYLRHKWQNCSHEVSANLSHGANQLGVSRGDNIYAKSSTTLREAKWNQTRISSVLMIKHGDQKGN